MKPSNDIELFHVIWANVNINEQPIESMIYSYHLEESLHTDVVVLCLKRWPHYILRRRINSKKRNEAFVTRI